MKGVSNKYHWIPGLYALGNQLCGNGIASVLRKAWIYLLQMRNGISALHHYKDREKSATAKQQVLGHPSMSDFDLAQLEYKKPKTQPLKI